MQGSTRLLTLVGPAGVGKTRLGLRLAAEVSEAYRDGVWFVNLTSVTDPSMLAHTVAQVMGARGEPGQSPLEALVQRLRGRHLLLVFDNCEHLLSACARFVGSLLGACPQVHVVAISREPLDTVGDTIWRVPPLSLPTDRTEVAASEAVQLFAVRARAKDERFSVTGANSAEIGAICRQVDGLPLALELVAARVGNTTNPKSVPLPFRWPSSATRGRTGPPRKRTPVRRGAHLLRRSPVGRSRCSGTRSAGCRIAGGGRGSQSARALSVAGPGSRGCARTPGSGR